LAAHEFRSPLTVVAGYVRMMLKERAGPLTEQQRRMLEEADKSCARLSGLLAEVSELAHLESGTAPFNRSSVDLRAILTESIAALPELRDRDVTVDLAVERVNGVDVPDRLAIQGDAVRLKAAFGAIIGALRRELVTSDRLTVHVHAIDNEGRPSFRITIGEAVRIDHIVQSSEDLATFDEWRGGNGLGLPTARRILEAHGGRLWGRSSDGPDSKATAVLVLPAL
jgi:signal transduction histidine kinase